MDRLEGVRSGWFSWDCRVRRGSEELTLIDLAALRTRAEFMLAGEPYLVRPESALSRTIVLECGGRVIARAERERWLPVQYVIVAGDRRLHLKPRVPSRRYTLRHGDRIIGEIRPQGLFARSFVAEFREPLPLPTEVFVLALVLFRLRRRARSNSG